MEESICGRHVCGKGDTQHCQWTPYSGRRYLDRKHDIQPVGRYARATNRIRFEQVPCRYRTDDETFFAAYLDQSRGGGSNRTLQHSGQKR